MKLQNNYQHITLFKVDVYANKLKNSNFFRVFVLSKFNIFWIYDLTIRYVLWSSIGIVALIEWCFPLTSISIHQH